MKGRRIAAAAVVVAAGRKVDMDFQNRFQEHIALESAQMDMDVGLRRSSLLQLGLSDRGCFRIGLAFVEMGMGYRFHCFVVTDADVEGIRHYCPSNIGANSLTGIPRRMDWVEGIWSFDPVDPAWPQAQTHSNSGASLEKYQRRWPSCCTGMGGFWVPWASHLDSYTEGTLEPSVEVRLARFVSQLLLGLGLGPLHSTGCKHPDASGTLHIRHPRGLVVVEVGLPVGVVHSEVQQLELPA